MRDSQEGIGPEMLETLSDLRRRLIQIEQQLERVNGDQRLLSIRAASIELGTRRGKDGALMQAIRRGELRCLKVGSRLKIRRGVLVRWVETQCRPRRH